MKKYLCILFVWFVCGISAFPQDVIEQKVNFQLILGTVITSANETIPEMDIRRYGHENSPLDEIEYYANVEYLLVVQPLKGYSTSYNFYWRLKSENGVVMDSHNIYNCGVHLGIYGMKAPEPGNYTVEVDLETFDKGQKVTFYAPFVIK